MTTVSRENVKLLVGIPSTETSKDGIIELLGSQAEEFIEAYCHISLDDYIGVFDRTIEQMTAESYNKIGNQGLSGISFSGVSENYIDGYSEAVLARLRPHRKLITL